MRDLEEADFDFCFAPVPERPALFDDLPAEDLASDAPPPSDASASGAPVSDDLVFAAPLDRASYTRIIQIDSIHPRQNRREKRQTGKQRKVESLPT